MPADHTVKIDQPLEFAGYDLVRMLGRGGMGEVWSVVRRGPYDAARPLAVKVMLPDLSDNKEYCDIFVAEGRITMQLSSSNIVPVFELGRHEGLLFMVMERIDGVNLADFQRRTRNVYTTLPLDIIAYIIGEILAALFVAHEYVMMGQPAGVIHRDVKPPNVIISSSGDIRLTDFGIARPLIPAKPHTFRTAPIGTLRYMSREQARGQAQRGSDLFAVGAVLHELLSGKLFRESAQTNEQLMAAIFDYNEVPKLDRAIPEVLERLRRGLLEPDPKRRFQSAAEAMECLSEWRGFRYARLKLARIYETAVGTRSSGFTESHNEAKPSFLLHHSSLRLNPNVRSRGSTFVLRRQDVERETSSEVDEDAKTLLRMPWRWRTPGSSVEDDESIPDEVTLAVERVIARTRREEAGLHPAVPESAPLTMVTNADEDGGARAVTPTLRLLLPVEPRRGQGPTPQADERTEAFGATGGKAVDVADEPPEPVGSRASASFRAAEPAAHDPREAASASGTIDAVEQVPELPLRRERPTARDGAEFRSSLYLLLLVTLLCALVGVSTAWFFDSRTTAGQEAKP